MIQRATPKLSSGPIAAALATTILALAALWPLHAQSPKPPSLDAYRSHALTRAGDTSRGAKLFAEDQRLSCTKCHSIDGSASKAGPDLFAAGDAFGRRDLVESILVPSAKIATARC
jgi:mono/diheme cytochrome c family protein